MRSEPSIYYNDLSRLEIAKNSHLLKKIGATAPSKVRVNTKSYKNRVLQASDISLSYFCSFLRFSVFILCFKTVMIWLP